MRIFTDVFSFDVVYAIHNIYIWILSFCWVFIADKICHMSLNCMTFDLDWDNTIMLWWYLESWLDNSYGCLLFTVSSICEKSAIFLFVAVLLLIPGIWQGNVFWISIPNIISVSGNLSHIIKLWVNLKSMILRWSFVIPKAINGDPSSVFNLVAVVCIGVLKLLSIIWYVEYLMRDMAAPESIRALQHFPACTIIVGQSMMSTTVTWSCGGSPPCSCKSLLGEGSISLKNLSALLSHWSDHQSCSSQCVDCQSSLSCFSWDVIFFVLLDCELNLHDSCLKNLWDGCECDLLWSLDQ